MNIQNPPDQQPPTTTIPDSTPASTQTTAPARTSFFKKHAVVLSVFALITGTVLVAGVLTSAQLSRNSQENRSDAAIEQFVNFSFGSATKEVATNVEVTDTVKVNTSAMKLSAAVISIKFDPQYITMIGLAPTEALPVILQAAAIDNTAGTAKIAVGAAGAADSAFSGEGAIAELKFKAKATIPTETKIQYDSATLQAAVFGQNNNVAGIAGEMIVKNAATPPPTTPPPTTPPPTTPPPTTPPPTTPPPTTPPPGPTEVMSLNANFKLQGLTKAGVTMPATITVRYTPTGATAPVSKTFTQSATSTASGTLAVRAFPLEGVDIGTADTLEADVFIKVPTSLAQNAGTVTLVKNEGATLNSTVVLPVGDFKRDLDNEANIIKLNDLALAITEFKQLENPVNDDNREFDVDYNGIFNLQDLAIVMTNFDQLEYPGETP